MELKDKVAVITGGSKGLGRALAEALIKEGVKVAICATNEEEVSKVAQEIGTLGIVADVRNESDMQKLMDKTIEKYGALDIWINNAGVWMQGAPENVDMEEVKIMFDINVIGSILGSRVALKEMKKKNSGVIINIISKVGLYTRPNLSMYVATKWALTGFTKTIREENNNTGIFIYGIYPGGIKTSMYTKEKPETFDSYMEPRVVADKVISNLKRENPELDLMILRENA